MATTLTPREASKNTCHRLTRIRMEVVPTISPPTSKELNYKTKVLESLISTLAY
jgi:hypothetical protein